MIKYQIMFQAVPSHSNLHELRESKCQASPTLEFLPLTTSVHYAHTSFKGSLGEIGGFLAFEGSFCSYCVSVPSLRRYCFVHLVLIGFNHVFVQDDSASAGFVPSCSISHLSVCYHLHLTKPL